MPDTTHSKEPAMTLTVSVDPAINEPEIRAGNRTITYAWLIGQRTENGPNPRTWDVYATLTCRHNDSDLFHGALAKHYVAVLSREERRDGMVSFHIGGPHRVPSVTIDTEPCNRFSQARFEAFAARALTTLRAEQAQPVVAANFTLTPA